MLRRVQTAKPGERQKPKRGFRRSLADLLGIRSPEMTRLSKMVLKYREHPHKIPPEEVAGIGRNLRALPEAERSPLIEKEVFLLLSRVVVCAKDPCAKINAQIEINSTKWKVKEWPQ